MAVGTQTDELAVKITDLEIWRAKLTTFLIGGAINGGSIEPTKDSWCGRMDIKIDEMMHQLEHIPVLEKKFARATGMAVGAFTVVQLVVMVLDKVVFRK